MNQYCSYPPTPPNAQPPYNFSINQTINSSNIFQCNVGFTGMPYTMCLPSSSATGIWSAFNGYCSCM